LPFQNRQANTGQASCSAFDLTAVHLPDLVSVCPITIPTLSFSAALFFQHSHTDSVSSKKKPKQPFCEQATFCAQSPRSIRFINPNYLKKSILNQSKTNVLASII
jgi:hypothetical protein